MLWVMLFHSDLNFHLTPLNYIKTIGYGGVDIFLFASGLGNYFSYYKDESPLNFLKRRIFRLAPVYVPFIIVWCIYKIILDELSPAYIIGNLFGVQGFSSSADSFNWYITALIICYILTPYFASYVKKNNNLKNLLLLIFLILISSAFWKDERMIISITRLPIYLLGMIFSKNCNRVFRKKDVCILALSWGIGNVLLFVSFHYFHSFLWKYGLYWYPFILITPFLCYAVSWLSDKIEKLRIGSIFLNLIKQAGKYSFELFLVHIAIFSFTKIIIDRYSLNHKALIWFAAFVLAVLAAFVLNLVSRLVKKIFTDIANAYRHKEKKALI